jgi:hypothetical protein
MRCFRRPIWIASALSLGLALGGCESFDPENMFNFTKEKPLPGARQAVFPEGVPGVTQGMPEDLMRSKAEETRAALAQITDPNAPPAPPPRVEAPASDPQQIVPEAVRPAPERKVATRSKPSSKPQQARTQSRPAAKPKPQTQPDARTAARPKPAEAAKPAAQPAAQDQSVWGPPPGAAAAPPPQPQPQPSQQASGASSPWPAAPPQQPVGANAPWPDPPNPNQFSR